MLTVTPAYGRDYTSGKLAKDAWNKGHDFIIRTMGADDGRYINKEQADAEKITICLRYKRMEQLIVIKPAK